VRLYRRTVTAPGTRGGQKQVGKALEGWGVLAEALESFEDRGGAK
jgi:hypothetical protein